MDNSYRQLDEGDLLAYMLGEDLPHVAQVLQDSPELQQELESLRQADTLFQALFDGLDRPYPQDMVDVITGQASAEQQRRVMAYVRQHASARADFEHLEGEYRKLSQTAPHTSSRLPRFIAVPLSGATGIRSGSISPGLPDSDEQTFLSAELDAHVTMRIAPSVRERWTIEGHVTHRQHPVSSVQVKLASAESKPRPRQTDEAGFFTFRRLKAGSYRLQVVFEQGILVIPDIMLHDD
jgi:hypothetical protein